MSNESVIENPKVIEADTVSGKESRRVDPLFKRNLLVIVGVIAVVVLVSVLFVFARSATGDKKAASIGMEMRQQTVRNSSDALSPAAKEDLVKKQLAESDNALAKGDTVSIPKDTLAPTVSLNAQRRASEPDFSQVSPDMRAPQGFGQGAGVANTLPQGQPAPVNPRDEIRRQAMKNQLGMLLKGEMDAAGDGNPQRIAFERNGAGQNQAGAAGQPGGFSMQAAAQPASAPARSGPKIVDGHYIAPALSVSTIDTYRTKFASASIVSGPLKGAYLLGKAELIEEGLSITFSSMSLNGQVYPVDAVALEEKTSSDAMDADINHRYAQRFVFPIMAAAVGGAAQAFAQAGTNVVATAGGVIAATPAATTRQAEAAGVASGMSIGTQVIAKEASKPLQATLPANTSIGILFKTPVYASAAK